VHALLPEGLELQSAGRAKHISPGSVHRLHTPHLSPVSSGPASPLTHLDASHPTMSATNHSTVAISPHPSAGSSVTRAITARTRRKL
jgi:hypothetical protein